jgi:hypothetical protein
MVPAALSAAASKRRAGADALIRPTTMAGASAGFDGDVGANYNECGN